MTSHLPDRIDPDAPIFVISVAAQLAEMHPQTLRGYDRLGLVVPGRTRGRGRRYSLRDIAKLRHIQHLSQTEGINLEGIRRILDLEAQLEDLQSQIAQLTTLVEHLHLSGGETRLFTSTQTGEVHLGRVRPRTLRAITR
ncbi:MAG: MerR family transcriptional regulator [Propionicimonas sp.]